MGRVSAPAAAVVGAAVLLISGGGAYALAASSGAGKISVCVHHTGGALYKAKRCARHDKRLTWNVTGPAGAPGSTGPTGPTGPSTGPAGGALSGSYPNPALAPSVITDANVKPGSLTGASINAGTLGKVPAAGTADTATVANSPGTLPSGKTERGVFTVEAQASGPGDIWGNAYSFPFPLSGTVPATYLGPGAGPTANCPGNVSDPEAAPGHLCVYAGAAALVSAVVPTDPTTRSAGEASPYGFFIQITSSIAGTAYAVGSWAVTAS